MTKPKILVAISRPATGAQVQSLVESMSFLSAYKTTHDIFFVTHQKTNTGMLHIEKIAGFCFDGFISMEHLWDGEFLTKPHKNWVAFYENVDWFSKIDNVEHVFLFGSMLSAATGWTRNKDKFKKHIETQNQFLFQSNSLPLSVALQLLKCANRVGAKFHEVVYDPDEASMKSLCNSVPTECVTCYHGYDDARYGFKRIDSLQYFLLNRSFVSPLEDSSVLHDICFGYTCAAPARESTFDKITDFLTEASTKYKVRTYVYHNSRKINTLVSRDAYLRELRRSRFTLLIPAYEPKSFSYIRFIEAIWCGCLPLVGNDVYYQEFVKSFGIEDATFKRLIHTYNDIPPISESMRITLLQYFSDKLFSTPLHLPRL
jgi:hypothetical protein